MSDQNTKINISVSMIGEFIRFNSCERRLKLHSDRDISRKLPHYERLMNPLDIVLQRNASEKENHWKKRLDTLGYVEIPVDGQDKDKKFTNWNNIPDFLNSGYTSVKKYAREIKVEGNVFNFTIIGYIDFILLHWEDDKCIVRIVECKASRKVSTYQHIQVALYRILVEELIKSNNLINYEIECVVSRVDEMTNAIQDIITLIPLDLSRETEDIFRILSPGALIERILSQNLDDLQFHLNYNCDNCAFNVNCLTESARLDKLEILGISPSTVKSLKKNGVNTVKELIELDAASDIAQMIRVDNGMTVSLDNLLKRAKTRAKNLPYGNDVSSDSFEVTQYEKNVESIFPPYNTNGVPLIRVYVTVSTDYVEKRLVALTAHITNSQSSIKTNIDYSNGIHFNPDVSEVDEDGTLRPLSGEYIKSIISKPWKKDFNKDLEMEETMIDSFFNDLYSSIKKVAQAGQDGAAPIHFYFWSRLELRNLIEACTRSVDNRLLHHLRQLMGCRDGIESEQLIYSCIQEEIRNKYALGWTSNGLSVVTSLRWFGDKYHWVRNINGEKVVLDEIFTQDIFDFKTDLWLNSNNEWFEADLPKNIDLRKAKLQEYHASGMKKCKFEIRSRFTDTLNPPYFYAFWGELAEKDGKDAREKGTIKNYLNAVDYIEEYLKARTLAVRWIEEKNKFKNDDIQKPLLKISELRRFDLNVHTVRKSAIDYLQLDYHVKFSDWIADHFDTPLNRVSEGKTLPLINVQFRANGSAMATINTRDFSIGLKAMLEIATSFEEDSFVRISRCSDNPQKGQSKKQLLAGKTCKIVSIDDETGLVNLSVVPNRARDRYTLTSIPSDDSFEYATMDISISDFISGRVEDTLIRIQDAPSYNWLTPLSMDIQIPDKIVDESKFTVLSSLLESLILKSGTNLADDQKDAIKQCLKSKIHLLQGPPGTGKSTTTSMALLLKIISDINPGDLVLVSSSTHLAVNSILAKIDEDTKNINNQINEFDLYLPKLHIVKLHSLNVNPDESVGGNVLNIGCKDFGVNKVRNILSDSVLIVGGTVSGILKWLKEMHNSVTYSNLRSKLLVIDEASMMVFPHFLALSALVERNGDIMLAGDHRQLSPIIAHDWDNEDRPPVILYKPYVSSYQAIWDIRKNTENSRISTNALSISQLTRSFRLPSQVVSLIARLYKLDNIDLTGNAEIKSTFSWNDNGDASIWKEIWNSDSGVFLVTHTERNSKKSNLVELAIIEQLMTEGGELPNDSTAIVTPHRAQRTLLQKRIQQFGKSIDIIETVEKLQGGERDNIIVSATASDPAAIGNYSEFILNLNRANVAFSRPKKRLIVVCSESLLNYIPADSKYYETAFLWKELRNYCKTFITKVEIRTTEEAIYESKIYTI